MSKEESNCSICNSKVSTVLVEVGLYFISKSFFCEKCMSSNLSWSTKEPFTLNKKDNIHCEFCGTTILQVKMNGKLGCDICYNTFSDFLQTKIGTQNKKDSKILEECTTSFLSVTLCRLNHELKEAVKKEDYESAAQIRDAINNLIGKSNEQH